MNFTTKIDIRQTKFITHDTNILMFGSCFAETIAKKLSGFKFPVVSNPMGISYNPLSIEQQIKRLLQSREFCSDELFGHHGLWSSWLHHSRFSRPSLQEALPAINHEYWNAVSHLSKTNVAILTLGSSYVYFFNNNVVNNCHKIPQKLFTGKQLSIDETTKSLNGIVNDLQSINKDIKIIFTISPIRYLGYGATNNQIIKATLILAIDEICKQHHNCLYFPSYEIIMDELRDYRFYTNDMIHINDIAVEYIWRRFMETYIQESSIQLLNRIEKINKMLSHRPLHKESCEYAAFVKKRDTIITRFQQEHPNITFDYDY